MKDFYINQQNYENTNLNNIIKIIIYVSYMTFLTIPLISYIYTKKGKNIEKKINKFDSQTDYKIVVYSCFIGTEINITSFNKQKGYHYFMFTDQVINSNINWTIVPIPKEIKDLKLSNKKMELFIKIHPHLFFKNYTLSIYINPYYKIKGDLDDFLINVLNPLDNIYITQLQFAELRKREYIYHYIDKYNLFGDVYGRFKDLGILNGEKRGIVNTGLIIRKHNEEECIKLMRKWWVEISNYPPSDNLAFIYAEYITKVQVLYLSYQFTLSYFEPDENNV